MIVNLLPYVTDSQISSMTNNADLQHKANDTSGEQQDAVAVTSKAVSAEQLASAVSVKAVNDNQRALARSDEESNNTQQNQMMNGLQTEEEENGVEREKLLTQHNQGEQLSGKAKSTDSTEQSDHRTKLNSTSRGIKA